MTPRCPVPWQAQSALALGVLGLSWLGMMASHELGHALGAWLTGGTVQRVVVPALGFSRTDVQPNPSPGIVVWAGPTLGVLLPVALWFCATQWPRQPLEKPLRFFAGFCLVANGAYLALGTFDRVGDVGVMLEHGTPTWALWCFGIITAPLGFTLWHGLGPRFGLLACRTARKAWLALIFFVLLGVSLELWARLR